MTKKEQLRQQQELINDQVDRIYAGMMEELTASMPSHVRPLRSCSAMVYETDNYYDLQSYRTVIACIDKATDTCADFLRKVYGYTATSTQHVTKFRKDYGRDMWGTAHSLTWKEV